MPLRRAILNVLEARRDRRRQVPPVTTDPGLPAGTARLEDLFAYQEEVRAATEHRIPAQRRRPD